jgi:hypothetical protein
MELPRARNMVAAPVFAPEKKRKGCAHNQKDQDRFAPHSVLRAFLKRGARSYFESWTMPLLALLAALAALAFLVSMVFWSISLARSISLS